MRVRSGLRSKSVLILVSGLWWAFYANAQISGPPTANCHVTDGQFTQCPTGTTEWSDVQPLAFPLSNSFLYVNQDAAHTFLYLMYDLPVRTTPLASSDSVHINFDTVETQAGSPALVVYDVYIFGNGQMQVLQQGQPTPPGRIVSAVGFGTSPNSATPHVTAELQVPLVQGPPSTYSPDPLFWSATVPPTPPPPPPPPTCPTFLACLKTPQQIAAWNQAADAALAQAAQILSTGQATCNAPVELLLTQFDLALEPLNSALAVAQAALARADLPSPVSGSVANALIALQNAENDLVQTVAFGGSPASLEAVVTTLVTLVGSVTDAATVSALLSLAATAGTVVAAAIAYEAAAAVIATGTCYATVLAAAAVEYAIAQGYLTLARDPPDPNFTVIATPVVPSLSVQPLTATTGFNSQVIGDLNSLFSNLEQQIALLNVIPTTINRVSGAVAAGNAFWQAQQANAAQNYASELIPLLTNESSLRTALTNDFTASGAAFTFSSSDVANALGLIKQNGLPAGLTTALTQLGLNAGAQAAVLQAVLSTDPALVAALGTGVFPQALSDPSFAAATNNAIIAFSEFQAITANAIFLLGSDAVSFHGDSAFASQLWAHLGTNVAYINDFGVSGATTVDGQPVTGFASIPSSLAGFSALFFASPQRCCNDPATDSSLGITSNAPAIASFLAGGGGLVVENFQGASSWDSILGFTSAPGVIYGVPSPGCSDPGTSTAAGAAAGFTGNGAGPNTYVLGCFVHQAYRDSFFASQGFTSLIDATGLASGSGVLLAKGLTAGTGATPVTEVTAAVVQANANGDTVVNLRGLASTDAPTLQDQIQMIVQSRVIQNPSLSASQLTTQLVDSLPPSVLPPGQAQNIINAVTSALAPPPPVISGMPGPGCSLWPPNHKLVQVATVTAADAVGGVLPGSFSVTGTSNEPSNDPTKPEIVITPNGLGGYVVQLQADRLGTGTGRIYTLTAAASNSVGITTTSTATCTVPHDQGH